MWVQHVKLYNVIGWSFLKFADTHVLNDQSLNTAPSSLTMVSHPVVCIPLIQTAAHPSQCFVTCMAIEGGGWTVFQKRLNGSVDFYLNWTSYKNGFGDLNGEYWLGNDNLHRLTAGEDVILRVDLEDFDGNITYAEYTIFKIANETDKYRILIGAYNGTAGDSLNYHK